MGKGPCIDGADETGTGAEITGDDEDDEETVDVEEGFDDDMMDSIVKELFPVEDEVEEDGAAEVGGVMGVDVG